MGNADADADDELRMLRRRREDDVLARRPPRDLAPGTPAMLGTVFNAGKMPTAMPGQFAVHPTSVGFTEAEGAALSSAAASQGSTVFTVVGTRVPGVGDVLTGYLVGSRWVAQRGSGGTTPPPPGVTGVGCGCNGGSAGVTPTTVHLVVSGLPDPNLNNATLVYGPTPAQYQGLGLAAANWFSTATFTDPNTTNVYSYVFGCPDGSYALRKVYANYNNLGFGQVGGSLYTWSIGFGGNTCLTATTPFSLETGAIYSGGSPQTVATVD
jgi:hypothetical protein